MTKYELQKEIERRLKSIKKKLGPSQKLWNMLLRTLRLLAKAEKEVVQKINKIIQRFYRREVKAGLIGKEEKYFAKMAIKNPKRAKVILSFLTLVDTLAGGKNKKLKVLLATTVAAEKAYKFKDKLFRRKKDEEQEKQEEQE